MALRGHVMAIVLVVMGLVGSQVRPVAADEYIRRPQSVSTGSKPDNWEHTLLLGK